MKHLLITFSLLGILFLSGCDDFKKEEKETISFNDVVVYIKLKKGSYILGTQRA